MKRARRIPAKQPGARPRLQQKVNLKAAAQQAAKGRAGSKPRFVAGEAVRIVPLHYPQPALSGVELVRGGDLFDGKPHVAPLQAQLTYRGGPLLTAVEVFTVFWGAQWSSSPSAQPLMAQVNQFFSAILASDLIGQLAEYSVPGQAIGPGHFIGTKVIVPQAPVASVTDSQIRALLAGWISAKVVPKNTANTLYFIYLEPGVVSIMGGSKSCQNYCGYHDHVGSIYYGVMPYPTCGGCLGGKQAFDALTETSSHELCEAITDPVPGTGWYDDRNGEIGDICAWTSKTVAGYNVQLEWSNQKGQCA